MLKKSGTDRKKIVEKQPLSQKLKFTHSTNRNNVKCKNKNVKKKIN